MKNAAALVLCVALGGCAYQLTLMPRDSGKIYQGSATGDGVSGRGEMTVTIEQDRYQGMWTAVRDFEGLSLMSAYGSNSRGVSARANAFGTTSSAGSSGRALLSAPSGRGLRCEFRYDGYSTGMGVCQDDTSRIYDLQILMK